MSDLYSIIGLIFLVAILILMVGSDYTRTLKAKRELDEFDHIADAVCKECVEKANKANTLDEVEDILTFMDYELYDENNIFKYPRRYSNFRSCYAFLKGKRVILIKELKQS